MWIRLSKNKFYATYKFQLLVRCYNNGFEGSVGNKSFVFFRGICALEENNPFPVIYRPGREGRGLIKAIIDVKFNTKRTSSTARFVPLEVSLVRTEGGFNIVL